MRAAKRFRQQYARSVIDSDGSGRIDAETVKHLASWHHAGIRYIHSFQIAATRIREPYFKFEISNFHYFL